MTIELKTCASIDYAALTLGPLVAEKQRVIRQMETLAADAQCRADLKDDTTWARIAYACRHEAMAMQWSVLAIQERLNGGAGVAVDTDVLWNIAEMMVQLAQNWRGP
jgi:hypothetical protein